MYTVSEEAKELRKGAYDLHIHAAPSPFNRALDEYGLIEEAGRAGMAGVMLKSHYESTAARADLVNRHCSSCTKAFGGIVLNWPVGGLNPYAVENALIRGARIVWLPTRDAAHSLTSGNMPGDFFSRPGISVVNESGELKPEIYEIFRIVKKYDAALATGHISPAESMVVCNKGAEEGVRMILTHPEFIRTKVSGEEQADLAGKGVYIEHCWYNIGEKECEKEAMFANIRQAGPDHCYLSTDRGQSGREHPVAAMGAFIDLLLEGGFTKEEIRVMTRDVPRKVLGIQD